MTPQSSADDLDTRLGALRESVADTFPPAATDRAIADAIAAAKSANVRERKRGSRWLAWPLALAASIAVLSFIVRTVPPEAVLATPGGAAIAGDEFMAVVPLADIQSAGDAMVVSARLSRMTLAELGVPVNPARMADAVDTELLVRGDGSVLAVRFLY